MNALFHTKRLYILAPTQRSITETSVSLSSATHHHLAKHQKQR